MSTSEDEVRRLLGQIGRPPPRRGPLGFTLSREGRALNRELSNNAGNRATRQLVAGGATGVARFLPEMYAQASMGASRLAARGLARIAPEEASIWNPLASRRFYEQYADRVGGAQRSVSGAFDEVENAIDYVTGAGAPQGALETGARVVGSLIGPAAAMSRGVAAARTGAAMGRAGRAGQRLAAVGGITPRTVAASSRAERTARAAQAARRGGDADEIARAARTASAAAETARRTTAAAREGVGSIRRGVSQSLIGTAGVAPWTAAGLVAGPEYTASGGIGGLLGTVNDSPDAGAVAKFFGGIGDIAHAGANSKNPLIRIATEGIVDTALGLGGDAVVGALAKGGRGAKERLVARRWNRFVESLSGRKARRNRTDRLADTTPEAEEEAVVEAVERAARRAQVPVTQRRGAPRRVPGGRGRGADEGVLPPEVAAPEPGAPRGYDPETYGSLEPMDEMGSDIAAAVTRGQSVSGRSVDLPEVDRTRPLGFQTTEDAVGEMVPRVGEPLDPNLQDPSRVRLDRRAGQRVPWAKDPALDRADAVLGARAGTRRITGLDSPEANERLAAAAAQQAEDPLARAAGMAPTPEPGGIEVPSTVRGERLQATGGREAEYADLLGEVDDQLGRGTSEDAYGQLLRSVDTDGRLNPRDDVQAGAGTARRPLDDIDRATSYPHLEDPLPESRGGLLPRPGDVRVTDPELAGRIRQTAAALRAATDPEERALLQAQLREQQAEWNERNQQLFRDVDDTRINPRDDIYEGAGSAQRPLDDIDRALEYPHLDPDLQPSVNRGRLLPRSTLEPSHEGGRFEAGEDFTGFPSLRRGMFRSPVGGGGPQRRPMSRARGAEVEVEPSAASATEGLTKQQTLPDGRVVEVDISGNRGIVYIDGMRQGIGVELEDLPGGGRAVGMLILPENIRRKGIGSAILRSIRAQVPDLRPSPGLHTEAGTALERSVFGRSGEDLPLPSQGGVVPGERLVAATLHSADGRVVFTGANHGVAELKLWRAAGVPEEMVERAGITNQWYAVVRQYKLDNNIIDGFETSTGRLLDRSESAIVANAAKQTKGGDIATLAHSDRVDLSSRSDTGLPQPGTREGVIRARHYGRSAGSIEELDPSRHGEGQLGAERKRRDAYPDEYLPRTMFYLEGVNPEPRFKGLPFVEVEIPASRIVSRAEFKEFWRRAAEEVGRSDERLLFTRAERLMKDAGFEGYEGEGGTLAKFTPTPIPGRGAAAAAPPATPRARLPVQGDGPQRRPMSRARGVEPEGAADSGTLRLPDDLEDSLDGLLPPEVEALRERYILADVVTDDAVASLGREMSAEDQPYYQALQENLQRAGIESPDTEVTLYRGHRRGEPPSGDFINVTTNPRLAQVYHRMQGVPEAEWEVTPYTVRREDIVGLGSAEESELIVRNVGVEAETPVAFATPRERLPVQGGGPRLDAQGRRLSPAGREAAAENARLAALLDDLNANGESRYKVRDQADRQLADLAGEWREEVVYPDGSASAILDMEIEGVSIPVRVHYETEADPKWGIRYNSDYDINYDPREVEEALKAAISKRLGREYEPPRGILGNEPYLTDPRTAPVARVEPEAPAARAEEPAPVRELTDDEQDAIYRRIAAETKIPTLKWRPETFKDPRTGKTVRVDPPTHVAELPDGTEVRLVKEGEGGDAYWMVESESLLDANYYDNLTEAKLGVRETLHENLVEAAVRSEVDARIAEMEAPPSAAGRAETLRVEGKPYGVRGRVEDRAPTPADIMPEDLDSRLVDLYRRAQEARAKWSEARAHETSRRTAGLAGARAAAMRRFMAAAEAAGYNMDDKQVARQVIIAAEVAIDPSGTPWKLVRRVAEPESPRPTPDAASPVRVAEIESSAFDAMPESGTVRVGEETFIRSPTGWRATTKTGKPKGKVYSSIEVATMRREAADPDYAARRERARTMGDTYLSERMRSFLRQAENADTPQEKRLLMREAQAYIDEVESRGLNLGGEGGYASLDALKALVRGGMGAVVGGMVGGEEGAVIGAGLGLGLPAMGRAYIRMVENALRSGSLYANPMLDPGLYRAARGQAIRDYILPHETMSTGRFGFATDAVREMDIESQAAFTREVSDALIDERGVDLTWEASGGGDSPLRASDGGGLFAGDATPNRIYIALSEMGDDVIARFSALKGLVTGQDSMVWLRRVGKARAMALMAQEALLRKAGKEGPVSTGVGYILTSKDGPLTMDFLQEIVALAKADPRFAPLAAGGTLSEGAVVFRNFEGVPEKVYRSLVDEAVERSALAVSVGQAYFTGAMYNGPREYLRILGRDANALRRAHDLLTDRVAPIVERWVRDAGGDVDATLGRIRDTAAALDAAHRGLIAQLDLQTIAKKGGRTNLEVARELRGRYEDISQRPWEEQKPIIIRRLLEDVRKAEAELAIGGEWYEGSLADAYATLPLVVPETRNVDQRAIFSAILGITSNNQKVTPNWKNALAVFEQFRQTGEISMLDLSKYPTAEALDAARLSAANRAAAGAPDERAYIGAGIGLTENSVESGLRKLDALVKERGVDGLRDYLVSPGRKHPRGFPGGYEVPMAGILFGEKVGLFMANVEGLSQYLTADKWWKRSWDGWTGEVRTTPKKFKVPGSGRNGTRERFETKLDENGQVIQELDDQISSLEHARMADVANEAARLLSAERGEPFAVSRIQSLLWYLEKKRYAALGAVESASESFHDAAVNALLGSAPRPPRAPRGGRGKRTATITGAALATALAKPATLSATTAASGALAGIEDEDGDIPWANLLAAGAVLGLGGRAVWRAGGVRAVIDNVSGQVARGARRSGPLARKYGTVRGLLPEPLYDLKVKKEGGYNRDLFDARNAVQDFERAADAVYGGVDRMTDAEIRLVDDAFKGKKINGSPVINQLPPEIQAPVRAMRDFLDRMSQRLIDEGVVQGDWELMITANKGIYARRTYKVFSDPTWADRVPDDVKNNAIAFLRREHPGLRESDYRQMITDLLSVADDGNPIGFMQRRRKLGSQDLKIFTKRKDIAPEIRALWGEHGEVSVNFSRSVASIAQVLSNYKFLNEARAAEGGRFFKHRDTLPGDREGLVPVAAKGNASMSPLDGWYTTPEIKEAFEGAPTAQHGALYRAVMSATVGTKLAKTLYNPASYPRNFLGNVGFVMANGHLNGELAGGLLGGIVGANMGEEGGVGGAMAGFAVGSGSAHLLRRLRPRSQNAGLGNAFKAVAENLGYMEPGQFRRVYRELLELGVVSSSLVEGELRTMLRSAGETGFMGSMVMPTTKMGTLTDKLGKYYQGLDDIWKIYAFHNELARYQRALSGTGIPPAEIRRRAAEVVRNTLPNYGMIPQGVRALQGVPGIGTFSSWPSEVMRVGKNTISLALSEIADANPAMKMIGAQRLAGIVAAAGFAVTAGIASRYLTNTSPEEEEAMRRHMAPWDKHAPILHLGRDSKGNPRFINLGYTDPWAYWAEPVRALLSGGDWETKAKEIADLMGSPFLGESMPAERVLDIARNTRGSTGDARAELVNPQTSLGNRLGTYAGHIAGAFEPGALTTARRIERGAEGRVVGSRAYNLRDELIALSSGQRRVTVDVRESMSFGAREFDDAIRSSQRILNRKIGARGRVTGDEIAESYREMETARRRNFDRMHEDVQSARRLGMSVEEIFLVLTQNRLSQDMAARVILGDYEPYMPGEAFLNSVVNSRLLSGASDRDAAIPIRRYDRAAEEHRRLVPANR
jgi:hypothetical protein